VNHPKPNEPSYHRLTLELGSMGVRETSEANPESYGEYFGKIRCYGPCCADSETEFVRYSELTVRVGLIGKTIGKRLQRFEVECARRPETELETGKAVPP
jgi:hypothetical protein